MATHSSPCLENPMDRGAWWAIVHGVPKSQTGLSRQQVNLEGIMLSGRTTILCSHIYVELKTIEVRCREHTAVCHILGNGW